MSESGLSVVKSFLWGLLERAAAVFTLRASTALDAPTLPRAFNVASSQKAAAARTGWLEKEKES
jgi:hypothetical protein